MGIKPDDYIVCEESKYSFLTEKKIDELHDKIITLEAELFNYKTSIQSKISALLFVMGRHEVITPNWVISVLKHSFKDDKQVLDEIIKMEEMINKVNNEKE